jgi:hypothetical protein
VARSGHVNPLTPNFGFSSSLFHKKYAITTENFSPRNQDKYKEISMSTNEEWPPNSRVGQPTMAQNETTHTSVAAAPCGGFFRFLLLSVFLVLVSFPVYTQEQAFSFGSFSFSLSPKILKDGSITDIGLGLKYAEKLSGELRFRYTSIAKNESLEDVADSLNAVNESIFEVFFLPVTYTFLNMENITIHAGGGTYYEYGNLTEKGFFNMPALENLGKERVNSYTNDFSMHVVGPLIDAGVRYRAAWFRAALSAGIVPVFFLGASQKMGMVPLLDPHYADYSQSTAGSPYFYVNLDCVLFKYVGATGPLSSRGGPGHPGAVIGAAIALVGKGRRRIPDHGFAPHRRVLFFQPVQYRFPRR